MLKRIKSKKKDTVLAALVSTVSLTAALGLLVYSYYENWTPFRVVNAETINSGQALKVEFSSKIPVKTKIEYGTSEMYLNSTEITPELKEEHNVVVSGIIPSTKHFLRLVAYTESGKEYKSDFFVVQ